MKQYIFSAMMWSVAIHIVGFVHLVGGLLIAIGLLTRFAAVIQIPILLCAVLFVNLAQGFSALNSELWLSIIVLLLLVLFWVIGSGPFSVDQAMAFEVAGIRCPEKRFKDMLLFTFRNTNPPVGDGDGNTPVFDADPDVNQLIIGIFTGIAYNIAERQLQEVNIAFGTEQ